jgi:protein-disulfide isomerase
MLRTALALILAVTPAFAGGLGEMTEQERAAFRAEVKAYLLDNPEILMEAMDVLQSRQQEAAAKADAEALAALDARIHQSPADWVGGNPSGDVTVVEFMDYRCGYCRKAYDEVADLVQGDGKIRFVVKEFPILGEESLASSQFAIAVRMLHGDAFYEKAHDALIALRGSPDAETLGRLAESLSLDPKPILEKMASPEVAQIIADNHDLAQKLNITGTPTFVIGGEMLRGYVPEEAMKEIVAKVRG